MTNIINISEIGNRLEFSSSYLPIVCGNSNYVLKFEFSNVWKRCVRKTAVFVVEGKKQMVDFDGDECKVPIMPNAPFVFVSLLSGDGDNQQVTTALKIRMEPTSNAGDFSEFDQLSNYLAKVIGAINRVQNGDVVAKFAETSFSQVDIESDQVVKGRKNFIDSLQKFGYEVLNTNEVSNQNILINGDFRVNQRGKFSYSGSRGYTVDRWLIGSGLKVDLLEEGIRISNLSTNNLSFEQDYMYDELKHYLGKTLTLSVMETDGTLTVNTFTMPNEYPAIAGHIANVVTTSFGSVYVYASGEKVQFTVRITSGSSVELKYIKLEIGNYSTAFTPRSYAEELALCQRYYEKIDTNVSANKYNIFKIAKTSNKFYDEHVDFKVTKRTLPTVHCYSINSVKDNLTDVGSSTDVKVRYTYITSDSFRVSPDASSFTADGSVVGYFEADAEIY